MKSSIKNYVFGQAEMAPLVVKINTANVTTGSSSANQFKIPLFSSSIYHFKIWWGDGELSLITSYNQPETTHTYVNQGIYTLVLRGNTGRWRVNASGERLKILEVLDFGTMIISTLSFYGCSNLTMVNVKGIPNILASLEYCFAGCSSLTTINNMNNWDVSNIISLANTFTVCTNFNQPLDNWNTSNVKDMASTFNGCTNFNQPLNNWNLSSVTRITRMFSNAINFNQPLNNWSFPNLTDLTYLFLSALSFNQPLDNWDVSNILNMIGTFRGASGFNQDISMWNFNKNVVLAEFMLGKTYLNYSSTNYDKLLKRWSELFIGTGRTETNKNIHMGTIKYSIVGKPYRDALVADGWMIIDGGML